MYHYGNPGHLKQETLAAVSPWVRYGLIEAPKTSVRHAMTEIAAIAYLIGKGYDPRMAHQIVESWEVDEMFHPQMRESGIYRVKGTKRK